MTNLRVNEIFYSLQGEGAFVGMPTVFLRLQGCNLRCNWCDTAYAQEYTEGILMSTHSILIEIHNVSKNTTLLGGRHVCITGGEPLTQEEELASLILELPKYDFFTSIETNGSLPVPKWFNSIYSWVADVKCPSSGVEVDPLVAEQWLGLREQDQVKFVVETEEDLKFVESILTTPFGNRLIYRPQVFISPAFEEGALFKRPWAQYIAEFCKRLNVRMSLQTHKLIWGEERGV